jgi:predicted  nucleic acid-binding Zn-ribbon protein
MSLMQALIKLNTVDSQLRGLRARVDNAQRHLNAQKQMMGQIQTQLDELQARKRHAQAAIGNIESEIGSLDAQIEKYRSDLNTAVTNKQYTAVLSEMNTVKVKRQELEEQELEQMSQIEDLEAKMTEVQGLFEERQQICSKAESELAERKAEISDRLAELEEDRNRAAADVPGDALAIFEELADDYDGEAMAPIEEVNRRHREYVCGACNMQVTFNQVTTAVCGSDTLLRCTACTRILYMQDELRGALTPS